MRLLDIEKVEAALKRAADRAVNGTLEERSGRFLVPEADSAGFVPKRATSKRRRNDG